MAKKLTMQQLIAKKKKLLRSGVVTKEIQEEINQINADIDKKTNLTDQNFFRTFYKTAKENLSIDAFTQVEGIASTRLNDYQKGPKKNDN